MSSTPTPVSIVVETIQLKRSTVAGARPATLLEGQEFVNFAEGLRWIGRQGIAVADLIPAPLNADVILRTSLGEVFKGQAIMSAGGALARVADPTNPANAGKVLGVAALNAQVDGIFPIRRAGRFAGTFNFGSPGPISIGDNGQLTRAVRTSGFSQVVGYSTDGTDLFVSLGDPAVFQNTGTGTPSDLLDGYVYIAPDADYNIPTIATHVAITILTAPRRLVLPSWDLYPAAQDLVILDEGLAVDVTRIATIAPYDTATSIIGTSDNKITLSFAGAGVRLRKCYARRAWALV